MSASQRRKGREAELEVAKVWRKYGFDVNGLEAAGDHHVIGGNGFTIHSEVKRAETTKIWEWWEQCSSEAAHGTMPVLHFRRNRSRWLAVVDLEDLAILTKHAVGSPRRKET